MPGDGTKTAITNGSLLLRYRRRLIRKRLLWRAFRKRRELSCLSDNRHAIRSGDILSFTVLRNEMLRMEYFLEHYRRLGVQHFFMVDNGSTDEGPKFLAAQKDVTLFQSTASYRAARFGVDWLNWLKWKHAARHWIVAVDMDELLIYPNWETLQLPALTRKLQHAGHSRMGALMLDMYPKGPLSNDALPPGANPFDHLQWFDAHGYWCQRQPKLDALWTQGGPRARMFFADKPQLSPTLNKVPLVHWKRGYAFVNSTHSALPSTLNHTWETPVSGVLFHTKFLPGAPQRAKQESQRDEHFQVSQNYAAYYAALAEAPDLWCPQSIRFENWEQLVRLGLMDQPDW